MAAHPRTLPIPGKYVLSSVDNLMPPVYVPVVWSYVAPEAVTEPSWSEATLPGLRTSFEATVREFFPLLNHPLRHADDIGFYVATDDDALPALFQVGERVAGAAVPEVGEATGEWMPPRSSYAPHDPENDAIGTEHGERSMLVRVTPMSNGVCIFAAFHHSVVDAGSIVAFMAAWSVVAEEGLEAARAKVSMTDDRSLLRGKASETELALPITCGQAIPIEYLPQAELNALAQTTPAPELLRKRYTRAQIDAAKSAQAEGDFVPTANEVVCTDVLKTVAARLDADAEFALQFPANLRGRYHSLPADYFGAAVLMCITKGWRAGEIVDMPAVDVARAMRAAKAAHTSEAHIQTVLDWEASRPSKPRVFVEADGHHLALTNWTSFEFYDITLGLGQPSLVIVGYAMWIPFLGYLLPCEPSAGRAIDVIVSLPPRSDKARQEPNELSMCS
ncbi:uncharacterized protein AMSG_01709 [Thecamonas trahens ATCC 50062]|uniref:Transferase n=1 Tax=Thecamonas trahens ATCC 50062 TaxID=461836 RepID=A0A0L0DRE0_THETB|nr:hypothetical protein AMSG_01709 [Thecamonas trahens ATCC 50062]KNC54855.1 hypothetical protein AMSG_01709 [Thecamonas trahens ATCC 50062]|eukprot:XP_013761752.1 hypothetical protein AMSG_01709 [Thecamonas trahens ATCC 50062]